MGISTLQSYQSAQIFLRQSA
ncbi:MAG: hypothetical protein L6V93_22400 [Clostridiales bacterium]|nr:MAG: hypothetical protein L6V93_22400 [Clostridiales bacterium]